MKIDITNWKNHPDGSSTFTFHYDQEFTRTVRLKYKVKRATKKLVEKFLFDSINERIKKENLI